LAIPLFAEKLRNPVRRLVNDDAIAKMPVFPEENADFSSLQMSSYKAEVTGSSPVAPNELLFSIPRCAAPGTVQYVFTS
jgi:hypothetical protein